MVVRALDIRRSLGSALPSLVDVDGIYICSQNILSAVTYGQEERPHMVRFEPEGMIVLVGGFEETLLDHRATKVDIVASW